MASQPSRNRSRWNLDFNKTGHRSELPSPPGYSSSINALHGEAQRQADPSLKAKRSWEIALGPIKQVIFEDFLSVQFRVHLSIFSWTIY